MDKWVLLISNNILLLVLFLITYFINNTSNNGIFFGVRFPKEHLEEPELKKLEKCYRVISTVIFGVIFLIMNIACLKFSGYGEEVQGTIVGITTIGSLVVSLLLFIPFYKRTKILKKEKNWTYRTKNMVVVDTSLRKPKKGEKIKPINSKWFLMLLIFPLIMVILTAYKYNNLPATIEIPHSNLEAIMDIPKSIFGQFEKESMRGIFILYELPLTQLFSGVLFYFCNIVVNNSRVDLNSGSIERAVIRKKKFKRIGSILLLIVDFEMLTLYSLIQCSILFNFDVTTASYIFMALLFLTTLVFIILFIKIGQGGRNIRSSDESDELYKDDDDKWILGSIYYNKNDPAWMVEKRIGVGWTVNFANPKAWIATGGLIAFCIIMAIISALAE